MYRVRRASRKPQCQLFCPVDCIPLDPNHAETREELQAKYEKLTAQNIKQLVARFDTMRLEVSQTIAAVEISVIEAGRKVRAS